MRTELSDVVRVEAIKSLTSSKNFDYNDLKYLDSARIIRAILLNKCPAYKDGKKIYIWRGCKCGATHSSFIYIIKNACEQKDLYTLLALKDILKYPEEMIEFVIKAGFYRLGAKLIRENNNYISYTFALKGCINSNNTYLFDAFIRTCVKHVEGHNYSRCFNTIINNENWHMLRSIMPHMKTHLNYDIYDYAILNHSIPAVKLMLEMDIPVTTYVIETAINYNNREIFEMLIVEHKPKKYNYYCGCDCCWKAISSNKRTSM